MTGPSERVLLGRIAGAHGLKGEVLVHSYTEAPEDIAAYGALMDAGGREVAIEVVRVSEKGVFARIAGVGDRTAAEALKGTELWIARDRLPEPEQDEFYHADLIGLEARTPEGQRIGVIVAVQNYGAGDLLEIRPVGQKRTELVPFTEAFVPEIALDEGAVVIAMPVHAADDEAEAPGAGKPDRGGGE